MSTDTLPTRDRILNACRSLLESELGTSTRMSDVANAAGVSRQAVYLHFKNRADLLISVTRHIDQVEDVDARLTASRSASGGLERLDAFIEAWGGYIPVIYPVARALMSMAPTDDAAFAAWSDRMTAMRQGCQAALYAMARERILRTDLNADQCTDLLWTQLSVRNWEHLVQDCGWSQERYVEEIKRIARLTFLDQNTHPLA